MKNLAEKKDASTLNMGSKAPKRPPTSPRKSRTSVDYLIDCCLKGSRLSLISNKILSTITGLGLAS